MSGDLQHLYDDPEVVHAMEVLTEHGIDGQRFEQLTKGWGDYVLGATLMVNREPLGHVEVVRVESAADGNHLYRYRCYEQGKVLEYGVIRHQESEGAYVLLRKALEAMTSARF